jgi:hypothetical protein
MASDLFEAFLASGDSLRVYCEGALVFRSKKDRLLPLMDYIADRGAGDGPVVIYDKVIGNGAALLIVRVDCGEVFSPLGSEIAVGTLDKHGIRHHFSRTVPFILRDDGRGMCPMEQLSIGKGPEEFFLALKARLEAAK